MGERECALPHPLMLPLLSHTPSRHVTTPTLIVNIRDNVEEDWQDWRLEQQLPVGAREVRSPVISVRGDVSRNSGPRQGSSGPRIATLGDTTQPDPPARPHVSDDEDEEEPGRGQGESWFAGGERRSASIISLTSIVSDPLPSSGISVENPGRPNFPGGSLVQDLLRRAAE